MCGKNKNVLKKTHPFLPANEYCEKLVHNFRMLTIKRNLISVTNFGIFFA